MSKKRKNWLIAAASLVGLGCIIFGGAMTVLGWDFSKLGTVKYETNTYAVNEAFTDISIQTKTANVVFQPSKDGETSVVCYEENHAKHRVEVKENTLEIQLVNEKKWFEYIGFSFQSPVITVYIPQGQYGALSIQGATAKVQIPADFGFESMAVRVSTGDVTNSASTVGAMKIQTSTGDIHLRNASAGSLDLSASTGEITAEGIRCADGAKLTITTGDIKLTDFSCKAFQAAGSTSDLLLTKVIAEERMFVETDTGDVKFDRCDAGELKIQTDTGDVTGSLLTPKIFFAETDTGKVDIPRSTTGGKCEITTDTGDIRIAITE